jgi:hypothetical protein
MWIDLRTPHGDHTSASIAADGFAAWPKRVKATPAGTWWHVRVPNTKPSLDHALGVLQGIDEHLLRTRLIGGKRIPSLYESGVRYAREPDGREWWQTVADNVIEREGDCEDLAGHRAADLVVYEGEPARAVAKRTGEHLYHAVVQRADGRIEDPSASLGMKSSAMAGAGIAERDDALINRATDDRFYAVFPSLVDPRTGERRKLRPGAVPGDDAFAMEWLRINRGVRDDAQRFQLEGRMGEGSTLSAGCLGCTNKPRRARR